MGLKIDISLPLPDSFLIADWTLFWGWNKPMLTGILSACGGVLQGTDYGTIRSPGYPGTYPINRDCIWTVAVSLGNTIQFTFGHLALEHHDNCSYDYLDVSLSG